MKNTDKKISYFIRKIQFYIALFDFVFPKFQIHLRNIKEQPELKLKTFKFLCIHMHTLARRKEIIKTQKTKFQIILFSPVLLLCHNTRKIFVFPPHFKTYQIIVT